MSIKIETQALRMIRAPYAGTGGRSQAWRSLFGLPGANDKAVQHGARKTASSPNAGWIRGALIAMGRALILSFLPLFVVPATAQNMLSRAMMECIRQGYPVTVEPSKAQGAYHWACTGGSAMALFSELRGRGSESKTTEGGTVRWPSQSLSCSVAPGREASCLFSIDVGSAMLNEMRKAY